MSYKYELHCHCKENSPCGWMTAKETAERYRQAGYNGVVLTDHFRTDIIEKLSGTSWEEKVNFYWKPYKELKAVYQGSDFFIGHGLEIRFDNNGNDILLYGFSDDLFLKEGESWVKMGLPDFYKKYHDKMLIIQAHPNRCATTYQEPLAYLHGIEVKNASPRNENHNEISEQTVRENPWLIATGGSDCHRKEDVAGSGMGCEKRIYTDKELIKVLKSKAFNIL